MTKYIRFLLLPFAALFEGSLWVAAVILAHINTNAAADIITLAERLPDLNWYFNQNRRGQG